MYRRIVVGVEPCDVAAVAARKALALGTSSGADVHLVCALPTSVGLCSKPDEKEACRHAESFLDGLLRGVEVNARKHVRSGDPAEVLLSVAGEVGADLLVVGSGGLQGARRVLGSIPDTISRKATCSVVVVCAVSRVSATDD